MNDTSNDEESPWTNDTCIRIALTNGFPSSVKDIAVQKTIVTKFLNFYLGGKIEKGLNVTDIVFAAISIMPMQENTEKFMWFDQYYKDDGTLFFLTPEDKLKAEIVHTNKDQAPNHIEDPSKDQLGDKSKESIVEEAIDVSAEDTPSTSNSHAATTMQNDSDNDATKQNASRLGKNSSESEINEVENKSANDFDEIKSQGGQNYEKSEAEGRPNDKTNQQRAPKLEKKDEGMKNSIPKFNGTIRWLGNKMKIVEKDTRIEYGPVENAAFIKSCNKLLEQWDTNAQARIILKYFFGVVGLTLMRGVTKSFMHLANTFSGKRFRMKALSFIENNHLIYSCPHKKCIKSSYRTFNRKEGNVRLMFAKIVVNSLYIDNTLARQPLNTLEISMKWNIIKISVMAHTADYGFGLVSMLRTLIKARSINTIIEATYCHDTANSWQRLVNFLDKYMSQTSKETTHHWARIIDPSYFKNLTCPNNYALAVILAVFIEKETNDDGIWKSTWVKTQQDQDDTTKYKELGLKLYENYKREGMEEPQNLIKRLTRSNPLETDTNGGCEELRSFFMREDKRKEEEHDFPENLSTETFDFEMDPEDYYDASCEVEDMDVGHDFSDNYDLDLDNDSPDYIDHWF